MKNTLIKGREVAPFGCVVCGKPPPKEDNHPDWTYVAGSEPLGVMTCSKACLAEAFKRYEETGRMDTPEMRAK